jgi:predicted transcriptional regulator of viral defense system
MTDSQLAKLKKLGIFNLAQAKELGISQQRISSLVKENRLKRVSRGIYIHPDVVLDRDAGFKIACKKFGRESAIGGLSALFYYNLTDQVPGQIWVIVPPEKITSEKGYRLIRTMRTLDSGVDNYKDYRIVSIERAVIEGLALATKIGERTALRAARESLSGKYTTMAKLRNMSHTLDLDNVLKKYFEAITA